MSGKGVDLKFENIKGHLLALGAAFTWPLYSLVKKKMGQVSVWSVGGFCLGAGLLCLITHALIEPRVVLQWHDAWILFLMGIGPFGISFYAWDRALILGDTRVIGALSYLTPVLSTLGLILFAGQILTPPAAMAMVLIIGGASSGLLDFLPSKDLVK
jgi:drug/metabolite transporter (DMT)-like permease